MTIAYGRLAAVRPANTNEQDLHALVTGSIIGAIYICNQDTVIRDYSIAITDAGTGVAATGEDWIAYETDIQPNITHVVKVYGMSGTATIRIQASVADKLSFVLSGMLKT